jgi:hypothetical protein
MTFDGFAFMVASSAFMAAFPRDAPLLVNIHTLSRILVSANYYIQVFFQGCNGPEEICLLVV